MLRAAAMTTECGRDAVSHIVRSVRDADMRWTDISLVSAIHVYLRLKLDEMHLHVYYLR